MFRNSHVAATGTLLYARGRTFANRHIVYLRRALEDTFRIQIPSWAPKLCMLFFSIIIVGHWFGSLQFLIAKMADFPEGSWPAAV